MNIINRFIEKNKFILTLFSIVICLSVAYGLTIKLDLDVSAAATSKTSASDYSWATMSKCAAQYLNQTLAPDGTRGIGVTLPSSNGNTGFAGAFFGFIPADDPESRFTACALESNTVVYSYATFNDFNTSFDPSVANGWKNSAKVYSGFGYALVSSGIDEPIIIGQTADSKRNIIGPIVLIVFLLCMALPKFFEMVLTFLSVANPFRLFLGPNSVLKSIVPSISTGAGFDNQNTAVQAAMSGALNTLSDTVTGLYNALYNLSFAAVIPIMIALALFSWLVLRKSAGSVFKKLAIRVVFIGLGVPLMLACYTAAIDSVKDFMINTATGTPITVITSTFCDYGSWALGRTGYDYMVLPSDAKLYVDVNNDTYTYDGSRSTSDRRLVQLLNAKTNALLSTSVDLNNNGVSAGSIAEDDIKLVTSVSGSSSEDKTSAVINLLQTYTKGEYITASNFAAKQNERLLNLSWREESMSFFNQSNSWRNFDPKWASAFNYDKADGPFVIDISESDAKNFAEVRLTGSISVIPTYVNLFNGMGTSNFSPGTYEGENKRPFSKMAVYNLLSSTFSDTAVSTYSTTESSTNQVQLAHYSVSIAGQGYMELAYVFDAVAIMCCLMVLGYGYGFALLFACFKGLVQIFPKVLTGMIGSIRGIAGSVALIAALIVEIIGTCVMYSLGTMFIGGIYELIEKPLATILTNIIGLPNQAAALVTVVASAVIIIKLTSMLLKYRTAVVKSVSETATSFINKFMETNVVAPNLEGNMSAGGLASVGLGMAMVGASTPAGSKLADRASELTDKLSNTDADKVATAAMTGSALTGEHGEKYANASDAEAAKTENKNNSISSAGSGGHYDSNVSMSADNDNSPSVKTADDVASDYVDSNEDDFEKSIGYSSPDTADRNDDKSESGSVADRSGNLKNKVSSGPAEDTETDDSSAEQADAGRRKIIDNSMEEISGTKKTDISSDTKSDGGDTSADAESRSVSDTSQSETVQNGSANKMVMTDSNGNEQEVSIVNAKTGAAYTQADKDAGENYDVVGSDGKSIYGNLEGGMSANTIAMKDGQPVMMVGPGTNGTSPFGGGGTYTLSQVQAPSADAVSAQSGSGNVVQNITQNQNVQTTNSSTNNNQITASSQNQTMVSSGNNAGSAPVNVNIAANNVTQASPVTNMGSFMSSGAGTPYVNVNVPSSGGNTGSPAAPASTNTVEREMMHTVTQESRVESVIYQNGGNTGGMPFMASGGQGGTVVNNNMTVNQNNMSSHIDNGSVSSRNPDTVSKRERTGRRR